MVPNAPCNRAYRSVLRPAAGWRRWWSYRYYTIEQLPRLNRILALKDLGLPLAKIAVLLQQDLPLAELQQLLRSRQVDLHEQIQADQARLNRLSARLSQLAQAGHIREIHLFGPETATVQKQPVVIELQIPIQPLDSHIM
jgi:DNA-binding transcriptional MerR regulator